MEEFKTGSQGKGMVFICQMIKSFTLSYCNNLPHFTVLICSIHFEAARSAVQGQLLSYKA